MIWTDKWINRIRQWTLRALTINNFARTDGPKRTGSYLCNWKGQDRSMWLLTQSLRGIHVRAHVNNMVDLATKLSNILPTLLHDFLSLSKTWKRNLHFLQLFVFFSWCKLAKIADLFELKVSRYHWDSFRSHSQMTSGTFELLANFFAPSEQMHFVGHPLNKENN
mgnify:CR=1 FL=1